MALPDRYLNYAASLQTIAPRMNCGPEILTLLREKYSDFGPTLAAEKLVACHSIQISVNKRRSWMTVDDFKYYIRAVSPRFTNPAISVTARMN